MKKSISSAILATAILAICNSSAHAVSFTENFEGGLVGWTTSGDVSIRNSAGNNGGFLTNAFTGGFDDATNLNVSGNNPTAAGGALETAAGLAVGALDLDMINQATEGSVLYRSFTVAAGDVLSFDWQFSTRDSSLPDYAFVSIGGVLFELANVNDATAPADNADYLTQTGVTRFEHVFASAGTFRIAVGVVDIGDYSTSSSLWLDNVYVGEAPATPEPVSTLALVGFAMVGCVTRARRRSAAIAA